LSFTNNAAAVNQNPFDVSVGTRVERHSLIRENLSWEQNSSRYLLCFDWHNFNLLREDDT
jgi:hypothetical protein